MCPPEQLPFRLVSRPASTLIARAIVAHGACCVHTTVWPGAQAPVQRPPRCTGRSGRRGWISVPFDKWHHSPPRHDFQLSLPVHPHGAVGWSSAGDHGRNCEEPPPTASASLYLQTRPVMPRPLAVSATYWAPNVLAIGANPIRSSRAIPGASGAIAAGRARPRQRPVNVLRRPRETSSISKLGGHARYWPGTRRPPSPAHDIAVSVHPV